MTDDCYFKIGETYKNTRGETFTVVSIGYLCAYTDIPMENGVYWVYLKSSLYNSLVGINQPQTDKDLAFACAGDYWVCCDYSVLEGGHFRTYAYLCNGRIDYVEELKSFLTDNEIAKIESFAETSKNYR